MLVGVASTNMLWLCRYHAYMPRARGSSLLSCWMPSQGGFSHHQHMCQLVMSRIWWMGASSLFSWLVPGVLISIGLGPWVPDPMEIGHPWWHPVHQLHALYTRGRHAAMCPSLYVTSSWGCQQPLVLVGARGVYVLWMDEAASMDINSPGSTQHMSCMPSTLVAAVLPCAGCVL
jgi:hypothetical protein